MTVRLLLSKEGLGVGTNYVLGKMDGEGGRRTANLRDPHNRSMMRRW